MNIFSKLDQLTHLTVNEKILVEFIKENTQDFLKMNAQDISQTCFISVSTIYRLCRKIEVSGLSELKVLISSSLNNHLQEHLIDYDYPIKQNETQYQITRKLKEVYDQTIISTMNLIDLEQLRLIASHMTKAKQIDVYTSAGNIYFAENFKFQMQEIGVYVNVPLEEYSQHLSAATSDSSHLAIVISFEGRGHSVLDICEILKKNKVPMVLVSSTNHHPLVHYGTYHLYLSSYENHYNKISSFSTRLSLLYLLDNLYACFFRLDYQTNIEKKKNYYHLLSRK